MSRRKQSNPRQIKRTFGEMEEGEEGPLEENSQLEKEGGASNREGSVEGDSSSSSCSEKAEPKENSESPKEPDQPEVPEELQEPDVWNGPGELELLTAEGESKVCARKDLPEGVSWGPLQGNIHSEPPSPGHSELPNPPVALMLEEDSCWLSKLPLVSGEGDANAVIYKKEDSIWCKTTKTISEGEALCAFLMAEPLGIPNHTVKSEPGDPAYPAVPPPEIQLLPQQAGMAAILATAVVNKDIFPCKDCGIWYRSERNLQAHLMYYCASRQNAASPAVDEKPKEAYPNERVCPFPQCRKSCPSASSLEIHMRSHSGERPFVCLICLSAFTTKANCERHLKVHTDTLTGVCHSCGFISTTRDILYSHLVTNHMICQPGSKGEVYSPGTAIPAPPSKPLTPGLSTPGPAPTLKCSFCGYVTDSLPSLQQHVVLHSAAAAEAKVGTIQPDGPAKPAQPGGKASRAEAEEDGSPLQEESSLADGVVSVQIKEEPEDEGEAPPSSSPAGPAAEPEPDTSSRASSPHSLPSVKVKSEIASPTPGSSPVPSEPGSGAAGGTLFLPQYVFGHEATVVPQASEILAKMSELVHSRLKQGHGGVPPAIFPGAPVPKGATCFECEITFNNINNYYVHKRLYCSSRRVAEDSPPGPRKLKAALPAAPKGPPTPGVLLPSLPPGDSQAPLGGDAGSGVTPPASEVKQEVKVEEGGAKTSPSPEADRLGRVSEDSQSPGGSSVEDPDDDPSRTVCEACNIRFSRHETYMVHKRYYCASRHDPPLRRSGAAGKVPFLPQPIRPRKRRKLYEIHGGPGQLGGPSDSPRPEAPPPAPALALLSVAKAAPSPSSSPDADGPIDLSKKPRLHGGEVSVLPAALLPLADYHECTACRISFHSLDSYLAHKKYYCPATPLQPSTLEQLQKIKAGAAPGLLKPRGSPDRLGEEPEAGAVQAEKAAPPLSPPAPPAAFPGLDPLQQRYLDAKALHLPGAKLPLAACPYCPLNGSFKGDLVEHFRNAHGFLVAKTVAGATLIEAPRTLAENSLLPPLPAASPPQPLPRPCKDSFNGKEPPVPSVSNGSPRPTVSPRPLLPISPPAPLAVSPGPEAAPNAAPRYTDKSVQTPPGKGPPAPVANGNHRYCRLCNIKFSSLSTFIAHKKYYCSSHAAEHVK
ncbi:zinc finger protein ZFPM1 isoform X2 [Hemicordylus capensis]|uniref:zinc finger protein ZFPM1 isoform X2 n=1 Tax=Hemicordylus capensis TaxID=884348 RepID=UPI0023031C33|nr:zinc finger protein ZFPM1 isoform X2 [Hemicordylus capensis]